MSEAYSKISEILSDPENIKLISEIAQGFMDNNDISQNENISDNSDVQNSLSVTKSEDGDTFEFPKNLKLLEGILGSGDIDGSIRLISAIKPYMSSHRRDNADTVIKMLRALKLISKSNISDIGKLLNLV